MWNVKRRQQITDLENLLIAIAKLDRTTGAITDLPKLIKKSQALLDVGDSGDWKNFVQYITDKALKNE